MSLIFRSSLVFMFLCYKKCYFTLHSLIELNFKLTEWDNNKKFYMMLKQKKTVWSWKCCKNISKSVKPWKIYKVYNFKFPIENIR